MDMNYLKKQQRSIHPRETANIFSKFSFCFMLPLFMKGFKNELEENDLFEVISEQSSKKGGDRLEEEWQKQKKNGKNLPVFRLILNVYGLYYLLLGLIRFLVYIVVLVAQPYLFGKLVSFFVPGQTNLTKKRACLYASFLIGLNFFQCIYKHNFDLIIAGLGIKIRTALCSLMYRKTLKVSQVYLENDYMNNIVNLITKDVRNVERMIGVANEIWIAIITIFTVSVILYLKIGVASLAGIGVLGVCLLLQVYFGVQLASFKMKAYKETDRRLKIAQEALSIMRIIKMYTWENMFEAKIFSARRKEMYLLYKHNMLKLMTYAIGDLNLQGALAVLLITYKWLGNNITAEVVFFILTCFRIFSEGVSVQFMLGMFRTAEAMMSAKRIDTLIKATDIDTHTDAKNRNPIWPRINLKNVTLTIKENKIFHKVNFQIDKGLTLITGSVSGGKSSLLKMILQEYKPSEGNLIVEGTISYASQEPWLFPSTIRQNIIFGEMFDEERYHEVTRVCALKYDFDLLEAGDLTIIEDRGINLSKGQLVRINLARAVYRESEIYLLDECLSALDSEVSAFIFYECFKKFLRGKLVILVTHNASHLKNTENVIILNDGKANLIARSSELSEDFKLNYFDNNIDKQLNIGNGVVEDIAGEDTKLLAEDVGKKVYQEQKKAGKVDPEIYKKYIQLGGGLIVFFIIFGLIMLMELSMSYSHKLESSWVNLEERLLNYTVRNLTTTIKFQEVTEQRGTILYKYGFLLMGTVIVVLVSVLAYSRFIKRVSLSLHNNVLATIINAPMQFFDTHFIGNILNRFSYDFANTDEYIPFIFHHFFKTIFKMVGIISLIVYVNILFLIPTAILFIILFLLGKFFLQITRSLKRLEASTRSPVVGHVNATLEGVITIRASNIEKVLRDEFDRHQDLHTSASYTYLCSMHAIMFMLHILCIIFFVVVVVTFLIVNNENYLAGNVGLAISQAYSISIILLWGIRDWISTENIMTSVERIMEYTEVKKETDRGSVLDNWPKCGKIKYENVYLFYPNSNEPVLKNINFTVHPKEKIGIVGRTGAGKSSIISILFRLYEVKGKITIDKVDLKTVSLNFLRSQISIIPQDPTLISGTIRDNIDPVRKYADEEIWRVIESVNLKKFIPSLDFEVIAGGCSNFSAGEKQLICLARAIIRGTKIVVLDEATSNLDDETDILILDKIREHCSSCTVLMIAHKLNSILNCDKVIVLDKGEIIEYGDPVHLLDNNDGFFYKMVLNAGLLSL